MTPTISHQPSAISHQSMADSREPMALRVLETIADLLLRQRAAIVARDSGALNQLFEALLAPMEDLAVIAGSAGGPPPRPQDESAAALAALARRVHDQTTLNRTLIRHGMSMTDHYVTVVSEAAASADQALFTGVG